MVIELEAQNRELRGLIQDLAATNAALTRARDRYQALYDAAPVPHVTVDRARTIVEANRAAGALLGLPGERLAGRSMDRFVDDLHRHDLVGFVEDVFARGHGRSPDLIVRPADEPGAPRLDVFIDGVVIPSSTGADQCVLSLVDITARRQAEAARRKAQDEVLSIVSHDLRGPLNAIVLACDALRSGAPAEHDECLRTIERSAARSVRLLQDLLQVVRIESGALPMQRAPVDLGELVRTLCADHRAAAASAGCDLTCTLGTGSLVVRGDLDRLYQIGANLLVNAFVHAPGAPVEVTAIDAGAAVVLTVTDQGPGIPLADQPKVFDRFRQTGRNRAGAGLGLTIVSGLVGAHGGTVRLVSQPGLGARFEITLPRAPADR